MDNESVELHPKISVRLTYLDMLELWCLNDLITFWFPELFN